MERNITFVGYHSKKASYSFLFVAIAILITAACCYLFAEENKKFASIPVAIIGIVFLFGFCNLLKMPNIVLEVEDDKLIHFYDVHDVKTIDLDKVQSVHYWPATISSIKISFLLDDPVNYEHFSFLVKNSKEVKKYLLSLFENYGIQVVKKYTK